MDEVSNFCPAIAVPTTVKMPDPMTAPMPRAVREIGPRAFFNFRSGSSESEMSLSMDLQQNSWLSDERMVSLFWLVVVGGCAKGRSLLTPGFKTRTPATLAIARRGKPLSLRH